MRFSGSSIFNGLQPSKMAMRPCIVEAAAVCDTLLGVRGGLPRFLAPGEALLPWSAAFSGNAEQHVFYRLKAFFLDSFHASLV